MREIVFYSDFQFGYHNREAEEKMARFAERGYRVHYVEQLGIRNPRPVHLLRLARRLTRGHGGAAPAARFDLVSPKLVPPRRAPGIAALNRAWLARQVLGRLESPGDAILWMRFPTPELVPLAHDRSFALVVYEVVDDHRNGPGMSPRLRRVFDRAENELLGATGVVFAWSAPLRDRLARVHPNTILASSAVDPAPFAAAAERPPIARRALYAGSVDFRVDTELLADVARLLPDWEFAVAGPVEATAERVLRGVANIELLGTRPPSDVPLLVAEAAVCLMPYRTSAYTDNLVPVKLVEYLAAGRPVVATPIRAARELSDVVALASGAPAFAEAIERAAREDSDGARAARVAHAAEHSWERRIDQMEAALKEAIAGG